MITGQFKGQVLLQQFGIKINVIEANDPEAIKNRFDDKIGSAAINSLG
jgi:hypothetical protein